MTQGVYAQHTSQVAELWKGMYNDEVVALKIFRVPQDDPQIPSVESVSTLCISNTKGSFAVILTHGLVVLQGNSSDEAGQT